jgi:hypothetical protein
MTYTKKLTRLSPLAQAMVFLVFLLMFIVRWFFFGSVLRSFNYDIILLPLAAIVGGLLIYSRYRQRERQRLREEHIKVAAIIERARLEAGLLDEEPNKVNEYHLDDEDDELLNLRDITYPEPDNGTITFTMPQDVVPKRDFPS